MHVLFLMHVDWGWAKQRPHHLAEGLLERGLNVRVLYKPSFRRNRLVPNRSRVTRAPLVGAAVSERLNWQVWTRLQRAQVSIWARMQPDILWLSSPNLLEAVPPSLLARVRLVYDCMDLSESFPGTTSWRRRTMTNEQRLLSHQPVVFASSQPIATHLKLRDSTVNVHVVPNGYDQSVDWCRPQRPRQAGERLVLGYFGTIAEWFDFETVIEALDALPHAELLLIGPTTISIPRHPRIKWLGPQSHPVLPVLSASVDVFVMPFRVTRLISAVDPVKLYEYIAGGRPVLAKRYPVIERFTPHVTLYDSLDDFVQLLNRVDSDEFPVDLHAREEFLRTNTWEARIDEILRVLAQGDSPK